MKTREICAESHGPRLYLRYLRRVFICLVLYSGPTGHSAALLKFLIYPQGAFSNFASRTCAIFQVVVLVLCSVVLCFLLTALTCDLPLANPWLVLLLLLYFQNFYDNPSIALPARAIPVTGAAHPPSSSSSLAGPLVLRPVLGT